MLKTSVNKVFLIGWVGNDVELRCMPSGTEILQVVLATHDQSVSKGDHEFKPTEWHKVDFIGDQAEAAFKKIKKGELLLIEGKLIHRVFKEFRSNIERRSSEILGSYFEVLKEPKVHHEFDHKFHHSLREEFERLMKNPRYHEI